MPAKTLTIHCWLTMALAVVAQATEPTVTAPPTVGMPRQMTDLVLPGTELEVIPLADRRAPIVVRITRSSPHGSAWRYDLSWYGLEPGDYDLRQWLHRKDGSATTDLPPLPVAVASALPATLTLPHELPQQQVTGFGSYRLWLAALIALWASGFVVIWWFGRQRRRSSIPEKAARPATFTERIRPLVARGVAGTISPGECAELERYLFDYWADRLELREQRPSQLFRQMRNHPEAGPLIQQLEAWLHQPAGTATSGAAARVDVETLLAAYLQPASEPLATPASAP